uniref:Uncharacterized protein n=1 Tax=Arundo donax TaxID=35708 RepID=A0A0A9ENT0_ARUDO
MQFKVRCPRGRAGRSPFLYQHVVLRAIRCSQSRLSVPPCTAPVPDADSSLPPHEGHDCSLCLATTVDAGALATGSKIQGIYGTDPSCCVVFVSLYLP